MARKIETSGVPWCDRVRTRSHRVDLGADRVARLLPNKKPDTGVSGGESLFSEKRSALLRLAAADDHRGAKRDRAEDGGVGGRFGNRLEREHAFHESQTV